MDVVLESILGNGPRQIGQISIVEDRFEEVLISVVQVVLVHCDLVIDFEKIFRIVFQVDCWFDMFPCLCSIQQFQASQGSENKEHHYENERNQEK